MLQDMLILLAGLACAAAGGHFFLHGAVGLARAWRLSAAMIGATVAAFSTSSPELAVAIGSALAGTPEISLGDALGSNVVNVALILGGALLFGAIRCATESVQRDLGAAVAAPVLLALLALDGTISRLDGLVLLGAFSLWLALMVQTVRRQRAQMPAEPHAQPWDAAGRVTLGLVLLVSSSWLIVGGAQGIARSLGWSSFLVGALIVALGTSTPEIVTTLFARWHGHDDIGLGTILGSNVFNLLFIVAVAALIRPVRVVGQGPWQTLAAGLLVVLLVLPGSSGVLARWRGLPLLACYGVYLLVTTTWR
ncbi:MAG: sodium:calcium antiporter [Opitutae bacterium]|nr:sodium:calcium antiporter [Opitutae bacterium]